MDLLHSARCPRCGRPDSPLYRGLCLDCARLDLDRRRYGWPQQAVQAIMLDYCELREEMDG